MTETIATGDYLTVEDPGDVTLVDVQSGEIQVGATEIEARRTDVSFGPSDNRLTYEPHHGEDLVLYAVSDATVALQSISGWSLSLFDRNIITVDPDPQVVTKQSFLGREELNGDQTADVLPGGSETTTFYADAGEIWEVRKIYLVAPKEDGASVGDGGDSQIFTVQTEDQGIEVARGRSRDDGTTGTDISVEYSGGEWITTGSERIELDDIKETTFDDTNGFEVTYINGMDASSNTTMTKTRTIRLAVEKVAI